MTGYQAVVTSTDSYGLGEGPLWDRVRDRVLWVDVNAGRVHSTRLAGNFIAPEEEWLVDATVGAVVCSAAGELLVAGARRIYSIGVNGHRAAGSLLIPERKRIESSGQVRVIDDDLSLSNGLAWSPAGDRFYNIDTLSRTIWSRAYDPETGTCGPREGLLRLVDGYPDGLRVDIDGNLWIAIWGAGEVRCYSPTGIQLASIEVDAPNVSTVAFVGQELDILHHHCLRTTLPERAGSVPELRSAVQLPGRGAWTTGAVLVRPWGPVTVDRPD